ncbi:hypothetical protein GUJ93_ZPchr0003g16763 [Zizania palustris]|uniref:RING-type domain-containing protein n=1 Tax=Zizania palustris TaxID=103762 RepID=A0A8J5V7B1_ZIZPA|nr:hypothetical protein GUJ93_ZPchr0003g16763 [Zizania palustris]
MASPAENGGRWRIQVRERRDIGYGTRSRPLVLVYSLPVTCGTNGAGAVDRGVMDRAAADNGATAASEESIDALKDVAAANVVDKDCAICFDQTEAGWKETPCGHRFHGECLEKWLSPLGVHDTCPMCRQPIMRR